MGRASRPGCCWQSLMRESSTRRSPGGHDCPSSTSSIPRAHFMRELNRLGVTGAIDAGGGFQKLSDDYAVVQKLSEEGQLTDRIAYNLFTQKPQGEKADFLNWTKTHGTSKETTISGTTAPGRCSCSRRRTSRISGAPARHRPEMEASSTPWCAFSPRTLAVALARDYDETISPRARCLRAGHQDIPLAGLKWFFRSCRNISSAPSSASHRLAGGSRAASDCPIQGEYFVNATAGAAEATPPVARCSRQESPSAGTDATRVASYNPGCRWPGSYRADRGGLKSIPQRNCLDGDGPRMWTEKVNLVLQRRRQERRGSSGSSTDLIVPDRDYFSCPDEEIADITAT